jgi:hypothetical protein
VRSNIRALIASTIMGVGAILLSAGPHGLRRVGDLLGAAAGYIFLAAAALLLLVTAVHRGAWVGPALLAVIGIVVLGLRSHGMWYENRWAIVGALLVVIGGICVTQSTSTSRPATRPRWPSTYRRAFSFVYRPVLRLPSSTPAPRALTLAAVLGWLRVDLSTAGVPRRGGLELFISCWAGGHVTVTVPADWAVVGGRLNSAFGIDCSGDFDDSEVHPNPVTPAALRRLEALAVQAYDRAPGNARGKRAVWVVVHVMGVGGWVTIKRGATAAPHTSGI